MPDSIAYVATPAAARYAKQLAAHLGRNSGAEQLPGGRFRLSFEGGQVLLEPTPDTLVLHATGVDAAVLNQVQDVVGRHLERFGQRNALTVTWEQP